jgi:hypothetical protein
VRLVIIPLQAQRHVSHQKPLHELPFHPDPILCLETLSIAELDIVVNEHMRTNNQITYLTG